MSDLNLVHAAQLARVKDRGGPRRGEEQGVLDLVADGAVAIRDGVIVAGGRTDDVLRDWDDGAPVSTRAGAPSSPGLIECHSHPLFAGERHAEYAERLAGASLAEIARRGGGIWASVLATRARLRRRSSSTASSGRTSSSSPAARPRWRSSPATASRAESELRQLELLERSRALTPLQLVVSFLGAHVVPAGTDAERYTADVLAMLPRVLDQGIAAFHDITCERGLFSPQQAGRLFARVHAARASRPRRTPTPGPARKAGALRSPAAPSRPST